MPQTPQSRWQQVLEQDEFNDSAKRANAGLPYYQASYVRFVNGVPGDGAWLDIGCGTGGAFSLLPRITHAIEPNSQRFTQAQKNGVPRVNVCQAYAESLPYSEKAFGVVSWLYGFFQCRSDIEALIEINRVLRIGGSFVLDVPLDGFTVFGRAYHLKNFKQWLAQFGFWLDKKGPTDGETTLLLFHKAINFGPECYLFPQLVPLKPDLYRVLNMGALPYWARYHGLSYEKVADDQIVVRQKLRTKIWL